MVQKLKVVVGICALAVLVVSPFAVQAQDASAARLQLISLRCSELETSIAQLQRRDLVSRTNLGREYETIARELDAFDQRIRNNDMDAKPFEQLLSQFQDATGQFRDAYVHYDDSLNKLLSINCQQKPSDFDTQLTQSRSLRDGVDGAAGRAQAVLGQYRTAASQLPLAVPKSGGTQ